MERNAEQKKERHEDIWKQQEGDKGGGKPKCVSLGRRMAAARTISNIMNGFAQNEVVQGAQEGLCRAGLGHARSKL